MSLVSASVYAKMHGKSSLAVRKHCLNGRFKSAVLIGKYWALDSSEPWPLDLRLKFSKKD